MKKFFFPLSMAWGFQKCIVVWLLLFVTPSSLSVWSIPETCRSAQHDAISALFDGYIHIKSALFQVAKNLKQEVEIRSTAKRRLNNNNNLVFIVLLCFRKTLLEPLNKNQFKLQRSDVTLNSTCEIYSSLKEYIMSKRDTFGEFEKEAVTLCRNESYLVSVIRKKKHPPDGSTTEITQESFCENVFRIFI